MYIKIIFPFLLVIALLTVTKAQQTRVKKVFLFAGQSNMDGRADGEKVSPTDLERLAKVADRIQFYYNHQPMTPLQITPRPNKIGKKFNIKQSFGPELFFGIELAEKYPEEEFIFIKRSVGGTSLYGCWNPNWTKEKAAMVNEEKAPKLYHDFIAYTNEVLKNYQPNQYQISAMLWVQGEDDSGIARWGKLPAKEYGRNLKTLISTTRDTLNVPELPFMIFQVGSGKVVKGMKKVAASDKNTYLIPQSKDPNSDDFYEQNPPPLYHYVVKSMKKIGVEFFKVYESTL